MLIRRCMLVAVAFLSFACSESDTEPPTPGTGGGGGGSGGDVGFDPLCSPPQVPFDGTCVVPGVPANGCAEGFEHVGDGSCEPILPDAPCGDGEVALPGETSCRPLADCGSAPWGNVPVEPNTEYVDASYTGMDSDGSAAKPWLTITEGIAAAETDAIIAVAAGRYIEALQLNKSVELWGRCPSMVEVDGGTETFSIAVGYATTGIHQLAVTGGHNGVVASLSDVTFDRVWVHDTGHISIVLTDVVGPAVATLTDTLVERGKLVGILQRGSSATMDRVVVRDTALGDNGEDGRGIEIERGLDSHEPSELVLRSSLIERNHDVGVVVFGSLASIDSTLIRDTLKGGSEDQSGRAISAQPDPAPGDTVEMGRADLAVTRSVLANSIELALFVAGSDALVEDTSIHDVAPQETGYFGRGIEASLFEDVTPFMGANVTVRRTSILRTHDVGMHAQDASVSVERLLVRNVAPRLRDDLFGDGLALFADEAEQLSTVVSSSFSDASRAGVSAFGAGADMSASLVSCAGFSLAGELYKDRSGVIADGGDNVCGCGAEWGPCKVQSVNLEPPQPFEE
jgi:hypothetical protein